MKRKTLTLAIALVLILGIVTIPVQAADPIERTYTLDADFDEGILVNVNHDTPNNDQLQLSDELQTLPFIWVANSGESTVSKIDTVTGMELGRYRTGPGTGFGENPSRTTVDTNGDLWVGNRSSNTAVKIALYPTDTTGGEAAPRPNIFTPTDSVPDGTLTTSTGSTALPWGQDDAVLMRIAVDNGPRAVAVDANNNVWIGGAGGNMGYYNGQTGTSVKNIPIGLICYGALVDGNGTLWISNQAAGLTRIDDPSGTHTMTHIATGDGWVYGIGIDIAGYIYTSAWTNNRIRKLDPATNTWMYSVSIPLGGGGRGVCVGQDGDVWVANSSTDRVTRHNPADGSVIDDVSVGDQPTGVAVDAAGKVWVTNYSSNDIMRIDPATNTVDFTQGNHTSPYNYSDMTGIIARSITTEIGTWTVDYDSGVSGAIWGNISWNASTPAGTSVTVRARSSTDGSTWSPWENTTDGGGLSSTPDGQYLQVETTLKITSGEVSPILYDLTVQGTRPNEPPDTSEAYADPGCLWPPNHKFVDISIMGVTDPDGDPVTITITEITSDEPTATDEGSGGDKHAPDAHGIGTDTASVRAERSGDSDSDGRVYVITFEADDGQGGVTVGTVSVVVPHDQSSDCQAIDSGQNYDATGIN